MEAPEKTNDNEVTPKAEVEDKRPRSVWAFLLRMLQGAVIGTGAILPGVSGGVLCVLFGIYRPMMELFEHPILAIKKNILLFIPVGLGFLAGFIGLARLVELLFEVSSTLAIGLFIGLIAGSMPPLFSDAGSRGRTKGAFIAFSISLAIMLGILFTLKFSVPISIEPNIWWYFVCGLIWGLSLILPGLSSSSVLIFIGLYQPMTAAIARLDVGVILMLIAGVLVSCVLFSRLVNRLFERRFMMASHILLGVIVASTAAIVPLEYKGIVDVLLGIGACGVGVIIALLLEKLGKKVMG